MKAVLHVNELPHQRTAAAAMAAGLARHGLEVRYGAWDSPEPCDLAVIWGAKQPRILGAAAPVLVMERGHVGDRQAYTSCGWNGLAGRGRYPTAADGGARWRARHGHLMQPWRYEPGYALVIGQVPGDAALRGLDVEAWAEATARALRGLGWAVMVRPHPLTISYQRLRPLAEHLDGAGLCVTYNSTAGVEAVLAGVPTVTLDQGAMAWPVTSHQLGVQRWTDREAWAHDLAWTQWTLDEIAGGEAWAHLATLRTAADET